MLAGISDLSIDELNKIPTGFNNNIIWNLGHLVASQQGLCYLRAGIKPSADENFISAYRSGSKPEKFINNNELEIIKTLLLSTLDQFETDYRNNIFPNYNAWTTRYGVPLTTIDDALDFLPFHEGLHMGTIISLKRLVKK
ncbi:MAG: DinB family protein [Chitinophagaceae bacterium]|nr:DinB family protein [Chitinophagaceae bacterium]